MPWFSCLGGYLSPMITLWYVTILWTLRFRHGMPLDLEISLYASLIALVFQKKKKKKKKILFSNEYNLKKLSWNWVGLVPSL